MSLYVCGVCHSVCVCVCMHHTHSGEEYNLSVPVCVWCVCCWWWVDIWKEKVGGCKHKCATDPKNASKCNIYWVNQKINFMIDTAGNHALTLKTETLTVCLVLHESKAYIL